MAQADCGVPIAGADHWPVATLDSVGLASATLCPLVPRLDGWKEANLHSVVVVRHGSLVFEHYFSGADERGDAKLGEVAFGPETRHDVRSVTKSIVALLLGIAIERGWVAGIDQPVLSFFPEYADLRTPEKDRITLRHLVTMSAGLRWNEDDYDDPNNGEVLMNGAPDHYRFVLEQPVVAPAGQLYTYNGGGTALIAAVLQKATGKPFDELARTLLFEPLDITDVEWNRWDNGTAIAASGLRMRPRDLAKIGQLVLSHGVWNGRQIVPASWVDAATAPQINGSALYFYGYHFWLGRSLVQGREVDWVSATGNGGQRVFIVPSLDLVVVVTAGLYHSFSQSFVPIAVLNRFVLAAIEPRSSFQRAHADPVGETHRVTTEKTAVLRDAERRDQLRVTIWYPATKDSVEQPLVVGPPDKPLFEVGSVAFDAPFADGGLRPILLLAPGGGASARMVGWFGIAMARAGYVVIAVDHPGDNGEDVKTTAAMLLAWDRAEDLRSALAAAENDPVIGPHLDRARVGAAGLSFGGYTALVAAGARSFDFDRFVAFCTENPDDGTCHQRARDRTPTTAADRKKTLDLPEIAAERARAGENHALPEVRAAFVMAPGPIQMLDLASLAAMRTPVRIMLGDEDIDVPPATNGLIAAKAIPGATLLRLPGVGHTDFLPDCTDAGRATFPQWCTFSVPQADTHRQAIAAAQEFFARTLVKAP
jgi:CubicO group peptidase (beta-lactamase class C family)/dienelactone hydrolase